MNTNFNRDIQAIHHATRYLLRTITVIVCIVLLFAAVQGVTDSIIRIASEQPQEVTWQSSGTPLEADETSLFFPATAEANP